MARLDIKTLVMAFEKRIEALEKNPPDKVPMAVIFNLLEVAVEEVIKDHFVHLVNQELTALVQTQFHELKDKFVETTVENLLNDEDLRQSMENTLRDKLKRSLNSI